MMKHLKKVVIHVSNRISLDSNCIFSIVYVKIENKSAKSYYF